MKFLINNGRYIWEISSCASLSSFCACLSNISKFILLTHLQLLPKFPQNVVICHLSLLGFHIKLLAYLLKGKLPKHSGTKKSFRSQSFSLPNSFTSRLLSISNNSSWNLSHSSTTSSNFSLKGDIYHPPPKLLLDGYISLPLLISTA